MTQAPEGYTHRYKEAPALEWVVKNYSNILDKIITYIRIILIILI